MQISLMLMQFQNDVAALLSARHICNVPHRVCCLLYACLICNVPRSVCCLVIHDTSHGFLTRCWTDLRGVPETGAAYNANVEALFSIYMATLPAGNRMQQVTELIGKVETEALSLVKKDDCLVSFVAVSK